MPNRLSKATHQSIETLHRSGHSNREIARLLSIDRGAVNERVRQIRAESQAEKESDSGAGQFQNRPNAPIMPTKPYTPEHKGKVESGVKYVKNNALTIPNDNPRIRECQVGRRKTYQRHSFASSILERPFRNVASHGNGILLVTVSQELYGGTSWNTRHI